MGRFHFILIPLTFFLVRCKFSENLKFNHVRKIYEDRANLIKYFDGKSIIVRGNWTILKLRTLTSENNFYFEYIGSDSDSNQRTFHLMRYELNDSAGLNSIQGVAGNISLDKLQLKAVFEKLLKKCTDTMALYSIKEVTSEFANQGLDLKFYIEGNTSILYVKTPSLLRNSWKNYIAKAQTIDSSWYYYFEESIK